MADFDSLETALERIVDVLEKTNDKLDRIMGVGGFTADLHDLKSLLEEKLDAIMGVGEFTADLHDLKRLLEEIASNTGG